MWKSSLGVLGSAQYPHVHRRASLPLSLKYCYMTMVPSFSPSCPPSCSPRSSHPPRSSSYASPSAVSPPSLSHPSFALTNRMSLSNNTFHTIDMSANDNHYPQMYHQKQGREVHALAAAPHTAAYRPGPDYPSDHQRWPQPTQSLDWDFTAPYHQRRSADDIPRPTSIGQQFVAPLIEPQGIRSEVIPSPNLNAMVQPTYELAASSSWHPTTTNMDAVPFHIFPPALPPQSALEELEQEPYSRGQLIPECQHLPTMQFYDVSLRAAYEGRLRDTLPDHSEPAWPATEYRTAQKLSIVLSFPGYKTNPHQYNVSRQGNEPVLRERLAQIIAQEMERFLRAARLALRPLRRHGRELTLDDLVLVELQHVSKGSLQPTIAVDLIHLLGRPE